MIHKLYGVAIFGFFIAFYIAKNVSKKFYSNSKKVFNIIFYTVYVMISLIPFLVHDQLAKESSLPIGFFPKMIIGLVVPLVGLFLVFCITALINPASIKEFYRQNKKTIYFVALVLFIVEIFSYFFN